MFSAQSSPIAIDFGSSSLKLLQTGTGDRPQLVAAAEAVVPDDARADFEKLYAFHVEAIPRLLREGRFKGRRAIIAIPSSQTFIQHMQVSDSEGVSREDAIKAQLHAQMNILPGNVVVRSVEVCPVHRNGQNRTEIICSAIARDVVMRYVDLLRKCKLEVVGVHSEQMSILRAFDHLNRRANDVNIATLYIDLGWSGTRVGIAHGRQLTFARSIAVGGRHFDQLIAAAIEGDLATARAHRLAVRPAAVTTTTAAATAGDDSHARANRRTSISLQAGGSQASGQGANGGDASAVAVAPERRTGEVPRELQHELQPGNAPRAIVNVDLSELLDTITDEVSMCVRYHQGLFRGRTIDRAIFVGGESRQAWLCQHLVKELRLSAQMGDPLARLDVSHRPPMPGVTLGKPQPGWAVACGLCAAPTDL